ncbi:hypothetical protein FLAG1_12197, partial [Fusarium langsethiae]
MQVFVFAWREAIMTCFWRCVAVLFKQIIQQFDITQESPPTVELSALTLRDDPDSSILPDKVQPRPDRTSDNESDLESEAAPTLLSSSPSHLTAYVEDGNDDDTPGDFGFNNDAASDSSVSVRPLWTGSARHNSQSLQRRSSAFSSTPSSRVSSSSPPPGPSSVSSAGGDESILSGYLQVIREQDTAGGPDFLRAQSVVYDRVLRTFFNHQCNCPNSHECAEYIGHYLPPLPTIFAQRDNAYDARASFPQWQDFLSDKQPEPLSLYKTQASLPHGSVVVARQWDVDSIWLGAKSLSAIRAQRSSYVNQINFGPEVDLIDS